MDFPIALQVFAGIFQPHPARLEKDVQFVAACETQQPPELDASEPVHAVRLNGRVLQDRAREFLTRPREVRSKVIRDFESDCHISGLHHRNWVLHWKPSRLCAF